MLSTLVGLRKILRRQYQLRCYIQIIGVEQYDLRMSLTMCSNGINKKENYINRKNELDDSNHHNWFDEDFKLYLSEVL